MSRLLPATFRDPIGLTGRLLRSKDAAAYFAMLLVGVSPLVSPLDLLLSVAERRLYEQAAMPRRPIVFVAGAPRSGTTVLSQAILHNLRVTYFNNLTMIFPRAPIVANRLFGRLLRPARVRYSSFYGRTTGLASPNDGLHLWDRWWGPSRYVTPKRLDPSTADAMGRFFGAYETAFGRPVVNKNNALATCASVVARALPTAHFVCIRREHAFNVQSIIGARENIQGSKRIGYGVEDPARGPAATYIEEICAQVLFHDRRMQEQERELGPERFWVVRYEDFCREPHRIVERVAKDILDVPVDGAALRAKLPPFSATNRVVLPRAEFEEIESTLARLTPAYAVSPAGTVAAT
jgi:hypothetical protein